MLPTAHAHASHGEVDEVRFSEPPHFGGFRFKKGTPAPQPDGIDAAWPKWQCRVMSLATASTSFVILRTASPWITVTPASG